MPLVADAGLSLRTGRLAAAGSIAAIPLVWRTLARFGMDGSGALWAATQLLLVFVACFDIATRRVPNRVLVPVGLGVLVLRGAFSPSSLTECALAAVCAFAVFLFIALVTAGGLGMGDVKLAGLIGLLLGPSSLPALFIGAIAGGVASAIVLVLRRGRGHTIAYAPYLCLGAAIAVLALTPPALV